MLTATTNAAQPFRASFIVADLGAGTFDSSKRLAGLESHRYQEIYSLVVALESGSFWESTYYPQKNASSSEISCSDYKKQAEVSFAGLVL